MCPPPCGPRRSYSRSGINTRITKREVDEVIASGDFECYYREYGTAVSDPYEGCLHNLGLILHDGKTKVKVAGVRSSDYKVGFKTIVMDAPCFPAIVLLRVKD